MCMPSSTSTVCLLLLDRRFFFLLVCRLPRSTLFPYTTLFRSFCGDLLGDVVLGRLGTGQEAAERSEEHTSELQSHVNLVCRLLLEKKTIWVARSLTRCELIVFQAYLSLTLCLIHTAPWAVYAG